MTLRARGAANRKALERLCQAIESGTQEFCLRLFVEDLQGQPSMWQLNPLQRKLNFLGTEDPVTLNELLVGYAKIRSKEKRKLALVFAYSLLLYHNSDRLSKGWIKEDISFFFKAEDEPDLDHPFLTARFNQARAPRAAESGNGLWHRNPYIFTLGVLLIEIFNEKPIEAWRKPKERASPTVNTDLFVARRIVQGMDQCPFRDAIHACLEMDWVPEMRSAELDDMEIQLGLLKNVIAPLEQEIRYLSVDRVPI